MNKITKTDNWLIEGRKNEELVSEKILAIVSGRIQLRRIELGLDQKQFAKLLGVTQGMVSRWESGMYNFTITTLVNICEKLGLTFEPQITAKEIEEVSVQETAFTIINCVSSRDDKYSDWTPTWNPHHTNNTNMVWEVA